MNGIQKIIPGTLLLKEKPFAYVLSSKYRTERCDHCFNNSENLSKCSACHYVYYCNADCQKKGWTTHKHECKNLKKITPKILPDTARLLARIIVKLKNGGNQIREYYNENSFRMFKDLMSHYSDLKEDKTRVEHFATLYAVLVEYLGDNNLPNTAELMGIYGRICINSFNVSSAELQERFGTAIYLGASIIDHSCTPTAIATFEGTTIHIRSLINLKKLDFSKVTISYIDVMDTTKNRQDELEKLYYFRCKCERCLDTNFSDLSTAAVCRNGDCDGFTNISRVYNGNDEVFRCRKCGTAATNEFVKEYREVMEMSELHLENMKDVAYLDVCKVCLKNQENVLHKFNILHVKIMDLAFESSIDFREWMDAKKFGFELVEGYKLYYGSSHPLLGLLYLKLGKILVFEYKDKEALVYLKKAFEILKITHGTKSSIFNELMPLLQQASMGF